ncbi:39S ribosomal protein L22, mitochondrial [Gnomoniopsis smithogilvyi]|uniref:39S ribosomal protein L22, mitochondrial n=1 Tax=Gnomoniopsis smithogilvyi TaxID=1191159 RepID=A0A9W9D1H3_9PEZI|nr:39S ribosomal protein L22, mitochondrial [Gnomoniopsis smithogilvyi]
MSIHLPSRRVLGTAPTILKTLRPMLLAPTFTLLHSQTRSASKKSRLSGTAKSMTGRNKPKDLRKQALGNFEDRENIEDAMRKRMTSTVMESQSIFDDDLKKAPERVMEEQTQVQHAEVKKHQTVMGASLLSSHVRHAVDPDPKSRRRWERKMVIRNVTRALAVKGKETREERIKRTERELLSRSSWLATSTKKLVHLARQVSGKSLEDARIQMKFSKKKFAKEVLYELDLARDKAVVERGMGLGKINGEFVPGETEPKKIRDVRHGKWVEIDDPTRLYVHEAWVNRGPWRGKKPSYRARGRTDLIHMPQASISIRLKEEKSRLREAEEREAKEAKRGPWIQLPNRPVTAQRPFYSW